MIKIISQEKSFSAGQISDEVKSLAYGLKKLSEHEEVVALYVEPSFYGLTLLLAAMALGKKIYLCSLREVPQVLEKTLQALGVKIIFSTNKLMGFGLKNYSWHEVKALGQVWAANLNFENFSTIMKTSGSTGVPKNAVLSAKAHLASARSVNQSLNFNEHDCWLLVLPLYHVSGFSILMRALAAKASLYVGDKTIGIEEHLSSQKISHCSLVPTQIKTLLEKSIDCSKLKVILSGGDALPKNLSELALTKGWPLFESYGCTESASMVYVRDHKNPCNSHVLAHALIDIADDSELLLSGASLFDGYLTEQGLEKANPSFASGDLGFFEEAFALKLFGRKSNRIISGGENIQAEEVEAVLESHPQIEACVVVPKADERWGQILVAFIKWKCTELDICQMESFLAPRLARYKWPRQIKSWPEYLEPGNKKPRLILKDLADRLFLGR